jgi:hypothetical protein
MFQFIGLYTIGMLERSLSGELENDRVTKIEESAFDGCIQLTSISFRAATTIANTAFRNCIAVTETNFPMVQTIGISAFSGCSKLKTVILESTTPPALIPHGTTGALPFTNICTFYVPENTKHIYESATGWSDLKAKGFTFEEVVE